MIRVVLLTKRDEWSERAAQLAVSLFGDTVLHCPGKVGDPFPIEQLPGNVDWLISFLSPWIVPASALAGAKRAINFHPASRDYPGIGCYNFCLYDGAPEFGAVCHDMAPKVDTGGIIEERLFSVDARDTVESLKLRTMITMLSMYHDVVSRIAAHGDVPRGSISWARAPFTRKQLNALTVISPEMTEDEIRRRVRATVYPGYPGPSITLHGYEFVYPVPVRKALA